jgi:hypothetical protein
MVTLSHCQAEETIGSEWEVVYDPECKGQNGLVTFLPVRYLGGERYEIVIKFDFVIQFVSIMFLPLDIRVWGKNDGRKRV